MGRYTVVITGASGSVYGLRAIEQLLATGHEVTAMMTEAGRDVTAYETGFDLPAQQPEKALLRFLELGKDVPLRVACASDLFDPIASGSHKVDGMVVVPASMGFCSSVAHGAASDLPERAADVMLKERRPLVLVPRETPLSLVHLRNLTALAEAGAIVVPAMPAFYMHPETIDDQVSFVVGKVLDILGIEHGLFQRWGE
ncbi:MAG: UbiX family flavin prenyltransferase [Coriobacteriia bacterium]|nr:UbiX family flavin prenyltransferase [Coriobacteriia bacterium]